MAQAQQAQFIGKVSRHSLHLSATKMLHKMLLAVLAVFLVAVMLQGCGCDEEDVSKCGASLTGTGITCESISKCYKDANCCDYEKDGVKVKDSIATTCAGLNAGGSATTNQCA